MGEVVDMLVGKLDSLQTPPKPFLSSPPRTPVDSSTAIVSLWYASVVVLIPKVHIFFKGNVKFTLLIVMKIFVNYIDFGA